MQNSGREKMGKKYLETKNKSIESSILGVWKTAVEEGAGRMDGRTAEYRNHRAKLESARQRREEKKVKKEEPVNPKDHEDLDGTKNATGRGGVETAKKMKRAQEPEPGQMAETNKNDKSDDGEGLDAVQPKAVKKKFKDRKDKDIDNDGDVDDSDKFLHKRRKAVSKAIAKEETELDDNVEEYAQNAYFKVQSMKAALAKVWGLEEGTVTFVDHDTGDRNFKSLIKKLGLKVQTNPMKGGGDATTVSGSDANISKMLKTMRMKKDSDGFAVVEKLEDSPNPANKQHLCAKNVVHEEWGDGKCITAQHAEPDEEGNVAWYDIMFEHGIEREVSIDNLIVIDEGLHNAHYDPKKKKKEEVSKTETGKKAAKIDLKPKIDD